MEQKFVSSGDELQQLTPEQVQELRVVEQVQETSTVNNQADQSLSTAVVTEEPQGSPLHNKAKNTPAPGGVADEGVYHSTAL